MQNGKIDIPALLPDREIDILVALLERGTRPKLYDEGVRLSV